MPVSHLIEQLFSLDTNGHTAKSLEGSHYVNSRAIC